MWPEEQEAVTQETLVLPLTPCKPESKPLTLSGSVCLSSKIMGLDQLSSEGLTALAPSDPSAQMGKQLRIMHSHRRAPQGLPH